MKNLEVALSGQYRAGLKMLRQAVERCPEDIWVSGDHPRNFWRIAYHAIFYADLYLRQNETAFQPWEKNRESSRVLWAEPEEEAPYTKTEILDYIDRVDASVKTTVAILDLETEESGFPWYKNISKLEHEIMSIRHLQGHVGQLSELLMAQGIDTDWIATVR